MKRVLACKTDFVVTVLILIFGVSGLVMAMDFQAGSRVWPVAILLLLIACTCAYLMIFFFGPNPRMVADKLRIDGGDDPVIPASVVQIGINILLITALIVAAPIIGLFVSAGVYLLAHMIYLGIRPLWLALVCAVAGTAVIYAFFGLALGVSISGAMLV